MKVAVIGATGFVGKALTEEFLRRNFEVTAISRNTAKLDIENANLTKKDADIYKINELSEILKGKNAVVSAFNPGWENPNISEEVTNGMAMIQQVVEDSGVKRFIVIGGAGTLKIGENYLVDGEQFPKDFYPAANAVRNYFVENLKPNSTLDWSFFSPAIEMNAGVTNVRTGNYRYGTDSPVFDSEGRSVISVQDLAVAVADELEKSQFIRKQFTAAYRFSNI